MAAKQYNITLGTAGHIDHGKTALVKCLTGCETDRLKQEKERGMSIELGFAPCTVADLEVGIVDVPGHENFIRTMVAGASGIDGVIFVVAADDGIMPQTREHFDILTLLGVKCGIVALTKIDIASWAHVEKITVQLKEFLAGTFLENAPICPVSNITGEGMGDFYDALKQLVNSIDPKRADGVFRLPVERTFSVKGYGTVVSGIPVSGTAKIGDEVVLQPNGDKGRIRAIQVYQRQSDTAMVGQCAALNIAQWDYKNISRGSCVTVGEYFQPMPWLLCDLKLLDNVRVNLKNGANVKLHTGTSEVVAGVFMLQSNNLSSGQQAIVQLRLSEPVIVAPGDKYILRSLTPVQTIGGGMIVEAIDKKLRRNQQAVLDDVSARVKAVQSDSEFVEYALKNNPGFATDINEISLRMKKPPTIVMPYIDQLLQQGKAVALDSKLFIHCDSLASLKGRILDILSRFHNDFPQSPGIGVEQCYEKTSLGRSVFDGVLNIMLAGAEIIEKNNRLALAGHRETFSDSQQQLIGKLEKFFTEAPFAPPSIEEITGRTKASVEEIRKVIKILAEQQRLVRVENDMYFHRDAVERAKRILVDYITEQGGLESVKFKYLLDTSRKYAIPLLDYFDRINLTRRSGYTRYLRNPNAR